MAKKDPSVIDSVGVTKAAEDIAGAAGAAAKMAENVSRTAAGKAAAITARFSQILGGAVGSAGSGVGSASGIIESPGSVVVAGGEALKATGKAARNAGQTLQVVGETVMKVTAKQLEQQ